MKKNVCYIPLPYTLFFIAVTIISLKVAAQKPTVTTSIDKSNIIIGGQFHYKVSASMPDNTYKLTWFILPDTLAHFKVVNQNKIDSSYANGNWNFSQSVILTSFDSGRQVVPELVLNFEALHGDSIINISTDSVAVNVSYSPLDSVKTFHDIKSIIEVKKEWQWWWWAILAVVLIALFFCIRFLIKFFKKKNSPDLFQSKLSPYDEAMQALADLDKQQLIQRNGVKEYHTKLTEIFKRYISRRTNSHKLHLTTDEILMDIDSYNLDKQKVSAFANCLRMSNAVKFAKYIPPQAESEQCLQQTKEMITEINKALNKKSESAI